MSEGAGSSGRPSVIGIDFGTTNSCVSFVDALGEPTGVSVATGNAPYDRVLASIVLDPLADREDGDLPMLGLEAEQARGNRLGDCYLDYFKHELNEQSLRRQTLIERQVDTQEHDFVNEGVRVRKAMQWVEVGGRFSREELVAATAAILERLLQRAYAAGADPNSRLLVGVPVNYSGYARKRLICGLAQTRDVEGRLIFSGYRDVLERTHFVLEPVAVAAAPGEDLEVRGRENVLIFDHGGGTLDLSLIQYEESPGFDRPVPSLELAAGGSRIVAGRHLDRAFLEALEADSVISAALTNIPDVINRRQAVERCKQVLSTREVARIPIADVEVTRERFEKAIAPLLVQVQDEVHRTLRSAHLSVEDVDWVVMTGGSSLVPAVQESVMSLFPALSDSDRVLRYFPDDPEGVEAAITDVAEGLARFGHQDQFEQIVLWDVDLGREESDRFIPLFTRGERYEWRDGRRELTKVIDAPDIGKPGCSFGLYEKQLDHQFMFGLAEVPPLKDGSRLLVTLRRNSLFPVMAVLDENRKLVRRAASPTGWPEDAIAAADISRYEEGQLEDFFDADAEYVPAVSGDQFRHAPLVRKLRIDDHVELSAVKEGNDLVSKTIKGVVTRIRPLGTADSLEEMTSWEVPEFEFTLRTGRGILKVETRSGCIRLAPKPHAELL